MNFDAIKDNLSSLFEKITDYCRENKRNAILICCLIICVLLLIILVCALPGSKDSSKKNNRNTIQQSLVLTEQLLVPDGPEFSNDYEVSRKVSGKWTEEEAEQWFVIPTEKDINALEKANDTIISEITGAAP